MAAPDRRPTIGYQPALDGLRAVAVIAVLLFHAEVPGTTGGYLGVSVFFTLSGFLITSLLVAEHDREGRIAVGAFYARRARRLLPASLVCLVGIVVAAGLTDWFAGVSELRRHVVGAALQVANWVFLAGEGSYQELFEESAGAVSPLEHYWSLAIEEQFYWIWPVAFTGLAAIARTRRARIVVLGAVTVAFGACAPVIAAVWGGDAAYWATPARAAEILLGALLAVVITGRTVPARAAVLAPLALGLLVVAFATFPAAGGPAYSGALPLVGVVSAALLLGLQAEGPVRRALAVGPLVWLGTISYGVYLYHWPIYVVVDADRLGTDGPVLLAVRLALTLGVAQASYVLVEQPIRRGRRWVAVGGRGTLVGALGATGAMVVATFAVVPASDSDYWTVSAADAEAARIEPTDEPLAPLAAPERDDDAVSTTTTSPSTGASTGASTTPPSTGAPAGASTGASTTPPSTGAPAGGPTSATAPPSTPTTTTPTTTVPTTTTSTVPPVPKLSRPVRIVVAGDSTAEATGVGLVGWAAGRPELAQVEMDAAPGCGFVRGGDMRVDENWWPVPDHCDPWLDRELFDTVERLRPDVVMLKTTSWDVLDRRWVPGERYAPRDPEFRTRIVADFAAVTDGLLTAGAGTVAWIMQPVPHPLWMDLGQTQEDPARHRVLYDTMHDLATERPGRVVVVDLAGWLASTGYDTSVDMRPDGVHWSPDASRTIAEEYLGDQLVRAALGLPRP